MRCVTGSVEWRRSPVGCLEVLGPRLHKNGSLAGGGRVPLQLRHGTLEIGPARQYKEVRWGNGRAQGPNSGQWQGARLAEMGGSHR